MKPSFNHQLSQRVQGSSIIWLLLADDRTVSTTNTGGWDKIILTDDDFPPGCAIEDLQFYVDVPTISNLKYNLRVEGAVRPDSWVAGNTVVGPINAAGYQHPLLNTRADMAVRTRVVLEVAVDVPGAGSLGVASFTIGVAARMFT